MAYGDDRQQQVTDTFSSSLGSEWENGTSGFNDCSVSGGECTGTTGDCRIIRTDNALDVDHYCTVEFGSFTDNNSYIGPVTAGVDGQLGCYFHYVLATAGTDYYRILEVIDNGDTSVVVQNTDFGGSLSAGDTITGEIEGIECRMGTKEGAGSDQSVVTPTNNSTWAGTRSETGVYVSGTSAGVTAYYAGDIAAAAAGQPTVKRFGGIPGMAINRGIF